MRRALGLLLLAAGAATSHAKDPPPGAPGADAGPPAIARTAEFHARVGRAIDRGVAWLRAAQASDGSFAGYPSYPGGVTALAYHTLRVCGVAKADPAARRAWDALLRDTSPRTLQTYSAALVLLAVAEHGDRVPDARDDRDVRLSAEDLRFAKEVARVLAAAQDAKGRWGYGVLDAADAPAGFAPGGLARLGPYDHSNTQFALLGLKAAARCGVAVEPAVWRRSLEHFLAAQERDGREVPRRDAAPATPGRRGGTWARIVDRARGWGYTATEAAPGGRRGAYPSMTAGGVSSIVICRSELAGTREMTAELAADSERAVRDGLAWLGTRWEPDPLAALGAHRPRDAGGGSGADAYEFYGVERAGILAGADWMADLDWYGAGAEALVRAQSADGSWAGAAGRIDRAEPAEPPGADGAARAASARRVADTCFALLFLKRGTAPVRRGAAAQTAEASDLRFDAAAKLPDRDLGDFLDLVLQRWTRAQDETSREALLDAATTVGPRIVEPLLARLDSPDAGTRRAADALLRRATGLAFGYDADAPASAREAAAVQWQAWWLGAKARLRYDPETRRLTAD